MPHSHPETADSFLRYGHAVSSLGLPRSALYKWKEQLSEQGENAFQGLGCRPAGPPDELTRLKKKLADTEMERDILKKAAAYFARQRK